MNHTIIDCIMNGGKVGTMEILLNPNLVYLVLVFGFLIAILALVSPGTGALEVAAIILIIAAGWQIAQMNFNWIALAVLIVGVLPLLWAMRKTQKWIYLILSLIALTAGSTFLFVDESWRPVVNPALAVLVNLLVIGFFWFIVRAGLKALESAPAHSLDSLIGSIGEAKSRIHREGSVQVGGELWSAVSEKPIATGARVIVKKRDGFTLEVEEALSKTDKK